MRLYHFVNKKWGLDNLKNRRLKISQIDKLNDPFEFLGCDLSGRELRNQMASMKKKLAQTNGMLCFSKNWQNPVQWAHYADCHKGLCLGFDVVDKFLSGVDYVTTRFHPPKEMPDNEFIIKSLFTKFSHWSYEEEYRLFRPLSNKVNGNYYYCFSEDIKLKQVIVGSKSKISRAEISEALGSLQNDIEVFKVRPAFKTFNIVKNIDESLWK